MGLAFYQGARIYPNVSKCWVLIFTQTQMGKKVILCWLMSFFLSFNIHIHSSKVFHARPFKQVQPHYHYPLLDGSIFFLNVLNYLGWLSPMTFICETGNSAWKMRM
jgi:hypothetical protein